MVRAAAFLSLDRLHWPGERENLWLHDTGEVLAVGSRAQYRNIFGRFIVEEI